MISRELCFHQLDPVHWKRLFELYLPPPAAPTESAAPSGPFDLFARLTGGAPARAPDAAEEAALARSPRMPALLLHRRGEVVRIVCIGGGTLPVATLGAVDRAALAAFRRAQRLPFVLAVDLERLPEMYREFQERMPPAGNLAQQHFELVRWLMERIDNGVTIDPALFGSRPLPSYSTLSQVFDRLLPDRRAFVFYLFDDRGRIYTSLIIEKHDGCVDRVTTHQAIEKHVQLTGSLRSDAKAITRAVGETLCQPHLAVYLPLAVWHQLLRGDRAAIARAMASRAAVVDPAPAWYLAIVGVGAMAEAANRTGRLASQLLSASKLTSRYLNDGAAKRIKDALANPLDALGLDPWEALNWAQAWRCRVQLKRDRLRADDD